MDCVVVIVEWVWRKKSHGSYKGGREKRRKEQREKLGPDSSFYCKRVIRTLSSELLSETLLNVNKLNTNDPRIRIET